VTIKRALVFLQNLYMMAITWGKATENTVKKVRFTRENNGRMRILTPEEETGLLVHCGPQLRPLVITASHTRFRASELLSLTWETSTSTAEYLLCEQPMSRMARVVACR
jgi:integrase